MTPILQTDRLILREFIESDYQDLCEILQDKEVMYAYEHPFSDDEVKNWREKLIDGHYKKHGFGLWAVVLKETNEILGQCGLTIQDLNGNEYLEIGYLFKKKHWHKGYAVEAAMGCKKYAFEKLNAEKVYSIIRDTNIASQNVAKRIGMEISEIIYKLYYNMEIKHYIYEVKKDTKLVSTPKLV